MYAAKSISKFALAVIVTLLSALLLSGCASSTCSDCGKTFSGKGYYDVLRGSESDYVMCRECAEDYYSPLSCDPFERK